MIRFFSKTCALIFFALFATVAVVRAQALDAVNDTLRMGPYQTVSKNIIRNDIIPGDTYSWQFVVATLPNPSTEGTLIKNGNNVIFTPATGFTGKLLVNYTLTGSGTTKTAEICILVAGHNNPANIIDPDIECFEVMPENVPFGIQLKYPTSPRSSAGNHIDGFTSPLVGDLNGDGKPEIVIMGNNANSGTAAATVLRYINIYNGQTGDSICRYDFTRLGTGYPEMDMGTVYHRAPSILALADLDNDGIGEIVMCHAESGRVVALKPNFSGSTIIGMTPMWEGRDASGVVVSYKEPATSTQKNDEDYFGYPQPYIADLNGDGKPEVIVYNKIYNGENGRLLMAWQNAGTNKTSSYTSTSGLQNRFYADPVSSTNANNVRGAAMVGRRPGNGTYADRYLPVIAIVDIDGDNNQEIIAGNRIHKFTFNDLTDHTKNKYSTIEGPQSVTVPESTGNVTYHLSDGFTRVADVDGDNKLDIIVATYGNNGNYTGVKVIVYVWNVENPSSVKACVSFGSNGTHGNFSIPFVGDINGKADGWDGTAYTKKLPEICILGGGIYINRSSSPAALDNRTGVSIHPKANSSAFNGKFNRTPDGNGGHIIGLTWDGAATTVYEKLKVGWGMEHQDRSNNTGITLFDFDNNNTADLCYRDEMTLRVISPARSGNDYVALGETVGPGSSIMFSTPAFSGTGFEYPVIADVNMDGSADIVVTHADATSREVDMSRGYIKVYEYQGAKWAPCPPVWNQGMYDPTQVREDLKINARPISMLKPYKKGGETIQPYNGSWMQRPIVRDENDFVPVVRHPNAIVTNMKVKVNSTSSTTVTLDIFNDGSATIAASAPVYFYDGKTSGQNNTLAASTLIGSQQLGIDIFPNESRQATFNITGNFNDHLIWATIIINKSGASAAGYNDCDPSNNTFSGADCPYLIYTTAAVPDTVLCGTTDNVTLTATPKNTVNAPTYQWYRNDIAIPGATAQSYLATQTGMYKCFVIDGICRGFTPTRTLTRDTPEAKDDNVSVSAGVQVKIPVLFNDKRSEYCNPLPVITIPPTAGTASVDAEGRIVYIANIGATSDQLTYKIDESTAKVYFTITNLPDIVTDPDCYTNPIATENWIWKMNETTLNSVDAIHNYSALTVGDIDDDDIVEIIGFRESSTNTSQGIKIFYFDKTEQKIKLKKDITLHNTNGTTAVTVSTYGSMAIARYNNKGYIIVAGTNNRLYAYDAEGNGTALWESNVVYNTQSGHQATMVGIADFDGNGTPEVYTGNTIFSIIDGHKICDGGTTGNRGQLPNEGCSSVAADIDGDGKPELCVGTQIYTVNIGAGSMSIYKELPTASLPTNAVKDGATQVADIDNDGNLDIIVVSQNSSNTVVYVWTPDATTGGTLMGSYAVTANNDYGIPSIGNIDADAYPEIVFTAGSNIYALDYNSAGAAGNKIAQKWTFAPNNPSITGVSLFDFNLDGENEIIYRDGIKLEILIGRNTAASPLMQTATVYSGTLREFPVIADIDDDGHAEIITTGRNTSYTGTSGYLRVFRSDGSPWSSARKIWNQYNYNVVNVNENLTIPPSIFNIAQELSSSGRPFNSFRRQMGYLNGGGEAKILTPDVFCTQGSILNYDAHQDILYISIHVRNTGDAALLAPFYISTYRKTGNTITTPSMSIDSSMISLVVGDTKTFLLSIRKFSEYAPFTNMDSITIIINNRDNKDIFEQLECNYANNYVTYGYNELLLAHNDKASIIATTSTKVGILGNDSIPPGCTPEVTITQPPQHGTATFFNDSIIYVANQGYAGVDTVTYNISCGDYLRSSAKIYIMVYYKPDNISDAECYTRPQSNAWNINDVSPLGLGNNFSALQTPLIGDIDGDGKPEILMTVLPSNSVQESDVLWIINGDGTKKREFPIEEAYSGLNSLTAIGRVKHPISDTTIIVTLAETTHLLYAYNIYGTLMWTSSNTYHASYCGAAVQLIDVDGDGWTEIVVGNKIFAAESGQLLCSVGTNEGIIHGWGGGKNNNLIQTVVGDVLGIGNQQLCIGNSIYRITITNRNGTSGNSMTLAKSITPKIYDGSALQDISSKTTDGATQLADFDLDGNLDIVVSTIIDRTSQNNNSKLCIYIWSPAKNAIIASRMISRVYKRGVPFIGDINGDGYPEIVIIRGGQDGGSASDSGHDKITALRYNPAEPNQELEIFWELTHNDSSGATGITLFDFNQDGISELVYRDNTNLRIINGSLINHLTQSPVTAPYDLETISCGSATCFEYPVVADIDNDGEAEIVITGPAGGDENTYAGPLRIFEAADGHKWAPARPVWNQYPYNAVNVNEDLTIPKIPLNSAIVFPGLDGVIGTNDDTRPYNNFLQQQTALNAKGNPIWLSPNAHIVDKPEFDYDIARDSASISVTIINTGSAAFQAPFYITMYRNNASPSELHQTYVHHSTIYVDEVVTLTFGIKKFKEDGWVPFDRLIIRTNDRGDSYTSQAVCDSAYVTRDFESSAVIAVDDHVTVPRNSVDNLIYVTLNDLKPCLPKVEILEGGLSETDPEFKVVIFEDSVVQYTPKPGYMGGDTLIYRIFCDESNTIDYDIDTVYITVSYLFAAFGDTVTTLIGTPITVDVLDNDAIDGICQRGTLTRFDTIANSGLRHGHLTINIDSTFTYTPDAGFIGVDSVTYFVKCGADSSAAKLYILIQKPQAMKYIACPDALVALGLGFVTISGVDYWWFNDDGTPAKAIASDTIKRAKDHSGVTQTWWAEPRFKNIRFERYRVDLEQGDCGVINPTGCAATGTVLYKEDFGGNSPGDPLYKPEGIPEMDPVYIYDIDLAYENSYNAPYLEENKYMIAKIGEPHNTLWNPIFDHTHPSTGEQGYFLEVNSAEAKGQFYSCQIDGLCAGTTLYFSAWINNVLKGSGFQHHVNQIFVLEDFSGNTIATYYTGDIKNGESGWKQYGFRFTVPENISSVKLRITNNGMGSHGNDFALDDIEIRFCAPQVTLNMGDSTTCNKSAIDIIGQYTEDCTFGNNLAFRWEFSPATGGGWREVEYSTATVDCKTLPTLQNTLTIAPFTKADEGYYRLRISSLTYIDHINCSASSDSIYIRAGEGKKLPDIRVDICPLPERQILLSRFIDSLAYNTVNWSKTSPSLPDIDPKTGAVNSKRLIGTFTYRYTTTSLCGTYSAMAYLHPLKHPSSRKTDTIIICKDEDRSNRIQINQILGLDLSGGQWTYPVDNDATVSSNVTTYPSSSAYHGALTFNGYKAWETATLSGDASFAIDYRGDTNAKKFVFQYTANGSCIGDISNNIVIVITEKLF